MPLLLSSLAVLRPWFVKVGRRTPHRNLTSTLAGFLLLLVFPSLPSLARLNDSLTYHLRYDLATPTVVQVSITFPPTAAPSTLIIPRTIPGGYQQRPYDPFVSNVKASTPSNALLEIQHDEIAPRWKIGKPGEQVSRIDYDVDLARMESEILSAADSSKTREGYVGLLGYSIFGFIEGRENDPIQLEISAPANWPVFSTLAPSVPAARSQLAAPAANYYALADSQITMGPKLLLRQVPGSVPLFLSVYAETDDDIAQDGLLARDALDRVVAYFGKAPFASYTVVLEYLKPISARHEYNFSMEHINSGTFYLDTGHAVTAQTSDRARLAERFNFAHHMAHSWIPKRAYGEGYLPFNWEMAPVIDTIWFNEGFGRYVAIEALAEAELQDGPRARGQSLDRLRAILDAAPDFIRRMSTPDLSREGSFLYSDDFRVGMNLFSRGALMAAAMDDYIHLQTSGKKSLRDALRHLIDWCDQNHRAFRTDELPGIFREATGVDTSAILDRWLQPQPPRSP